MCRAGITKKTDQENLWIDSFFRTPLNSFHLPPKLLEKEIKVDKQKTTTRASKISSCSRKYRFTLETLDPSHQGYTRNIILLYNLSLVCIL